MSSNIAEVTGKMPFSGKYLVKYWYQKGREASRNGETRGKLTNAAALGAFAVMHAMQLKMGITELTHDAGQNPLAVGIDALYTTANAMATYTQAYLAAKVVATPVQSEVPAMVTPDSMLTGSIALGDTERPEITMGTPRLADIIVTAGGQALFLATMH